MTAAGAPPAEPVRYRDRLLAEAVRVYEELHGDCPERPEELEALRASEAPLEERIVRRARGLAPSASLANALERLSQLLRAAFLVALVLALVSGAAAAHGALGFGREEQINVSVVVGALLVVQTAFLVVWLVALFLLPGSSGISSVGAALVALARRLFRRMHAGEHGAAASAAFADVAARTPLGKWTVGALSNGLWLAFNVGALVTLIFLLSTRHYVFVWETTLLSEHTFEHLVRTAGALPALLGFDVPDAAAIQGSRWGSGVAPDEATRVAWSGFLLGSVVVYGLLPRAFLFAAMAARRAVVARRYRLDLDRPGFARLRARLLPGSRSLGVVDEDDGPEPRHTPLPKRTDGARPLGEPAWVGVELAPPERGWPPSLGPAGGTAGGTPRVRDLGFVDDGNDRRRVLSALDESSTEPATLVVACALTTTPDRGIRTFLEELRARVSTPLTLVLSEGQQLRRRTDEAGVRERVGHWRAMAAQAGLAPERVLELDLEHLAADRVAPLAALLGTAGPAAAGDLAPTPRRRLEAAFALIDEHAARWRGAPSLEEQAALHRAIGELYGSQAGRAWKQLLRTHELGALATSLRADLPGGLEAGARRTLDLLPARLRTSPRWIAAGAMTGTVACLAAAAAAGPAALAALPSFAAVGGTLGGLVKLLRKEHGTGEREHDAAEEDLGEAVRAASLAALLLELGGEGEARITSLLDAALGPDEPLRRPGDVAPWLEAVRHRLDVARAEGAS